jgi:hypothetical protein
MRRSPRTLLRRLGIGVASGARAEAAPERLRSRLLETVRREQPDERGKHPRRSPASRLALLAAGIAIDATAVTAVTLAIDLSAGGHPTATHPAWSNPGASLHRVGARAELVVSGMSEPPIGEVYEVWTEIPGEAPRATDSLFTVASDGSGSADVPGSLRGVREVMVTTEPLGGSEHPTSLAVLRVRTPGR